MTDVWFTSDLHIGHGFIASLRHATKLTGRLPDMDEARRTSDAFTNWHDATLAQNWDEVINKDDQVWVLGDISAGGTQAQMRALDWLMDRPGIKHLISGNHDGVHPMHTDAHKLHGRYLEAFVTVSSTATRKITVEPGQLRKRVLLNHFPYEGDHYDGDRFESHRLRDTGDPLLHGHVHTQQRVTHSTLMTQQIHVGLDAWDLTPVRLDTIERLLT